MGPGGRLVKPRHAYPDTLPDPRSEVPDARGPYCKHPLHTGLVEGSKYLESITNGDRAHREKPPGCELRACPKGRRHPRVLKAPASWGKRPPGSRASSDVELWSIPEWLWPCPWPEPAHTAQGTQILANSKPRIQTPAVGAAYEELPSVAWSDRDGPTKTRERRR